MVCEPRGEKMCTKLHRPKILTFGGLEVRHLIQKQRCTPSITFEEKAR